jgi:hypothetical protein
VRTLKNSKKIIAKLTLAVSAILLTGAFLINTQSVFTPPFYGSAPETPTCSTLIDRLEDCVTANLFAQIDNEFALDNAPESEYARTAVILQVIGDSTNTQNQETLVENILNVANANPTCTKDALLHYVRYSNSAYKTHLSDSMTKDGVRMLSKSLKSLGNANVKAFNMSLTTYLKFAAQNTVNAKEINQYGDLMKLHNNVSVCNVLA